MKSQPTGWRSMAAAGFDSELFEVEKPQLFEAARLAVKALGLPAGARFILDQLCGFYGGEPIQGKLLVWPSNSLLSDRTGLSERTIRYAVRTLITSGLISAKDSANGKRYARRSPSGQIIDAFGFDLSPLLARFGEFKSVVDQMRAQEAERKSQFEEITICRRSVQEAIRALQNWFPETNISTLCDRFDTLRDKTPRKGANAAVSDILEEWRDLKKLSEEIYTTACGGNNCRHKDNNNDTLDQYCNKGGEDLSEAVAEAEPQIEFEDLVSACPDAFRYTGLPKSAVELVEKAAQFRGAFGINVSAWDAACDNLGPIRAATLFYIVVQLQAKNNGAAERIRNPGGYFRAMARLVQADKVDLTVEIKKMMQWRN